MASVITIAFEGWKAQEAASGKPVLLNEFVFANVPNLDPNKPIDRNEKLPPANQIVHRQAVNKAGLASENAVAYSVTLGADVGDFDFNWIGLLNKESNTVAMITHAPSQKKLKTQNGQQGNVLIRSFLLEFQGAAEETQIKTSAETWQIDFTARLTGIDEMQRLINVDSYGAAAFFDDGFEVTRSAEQFTVKKGLGYVGGLRGQLEQNQILNGLRNTKVYADFSYQGNIVSQWRTVIKITAAATLTNYVDAAGFTHQVFAVASIDASGSVKDLRPKGALSNQSLAEFEKKFNSGLEKKQDKGDYALRGESYTKTETNIKFQPIGNYQPSGDYATNTALNNGLALKFDKTSVAQGAGTSTTQVMSQDAATKSFANRSLIDAFDGAATKIKSNNGNASLVLGSTGYLFVKNEVTGVNNFSIDSSGRINDGLALIKVGGTGGKTAEEARHNLDIYSKAEINLMVVPIGSSIIWNTTAPIPSNYWPNEGRSFSESEYPDAAKIFPALKLPDDRGYAVRIADNGRGIDSWPNRTVGTYQEDAAQNMTGSITTAIRTHSQASGDGVFNKTQSVEMKGALDSVGVGTFINMKFDASDSVRTSSETRMKNVAKILITRMK